MSIRFTGGSPRQSSGYRAGFDDAFRGRPQFDAFDPTEMEYADYVAGYKSDEVISARRDYEAAEAAVRHQDEDHDPWCRCISCHVPDGDFLDE